MDLSLYFSSLILGLIEGATEFLPVSSTGHLIIAGELLNFKQASANVFEIFIQLGAILAIVVEYRKILFKVASNALHDRTSQDFVFRLFIFFHTFRCSIVSDVLCDFHGTEMRTTHRAKVCLFSAFLRQGFIVKFFCFFWI